MPRGLPNLGDKSAVRALGFGFWMALLLFTSVGTAPAGDPDGRVSQAALLLLLLAGLLLALLVSIALMTVIRRARRRASVKSSNTAPLADPWQESANRVRVHRPDGDSPPR